MKPFFNVQSVDQVHGYADRLSPLSPEIINLTQAGGRILARDFTSPTDLPGFKRSTMDGFALGSRDTFGASETSPGYLEIVGEVRMGVEPDFELKRGQCARIGTGGMLPKGADSVLMVEHTRLLDDTTLEVIKSVAPKGNTMGPSDDAYSGETLLKAGHRLKPQDIGLLAALGQLEVHVVKRPVVGIVSTGDEVVPVEQTPRPGQVRNVNTYTLSQQVLFAGGMPREMGLVGDDEKVLTEKVAQSLEECDLTLLSGGSSVGVRDLTAKVFLSFPTAELLVHGVGVSPGKPFIWVATEKGQLLGLPGQVASCVVAFHVFVEPVIERLLGRPVKAFARFPRKIGSLSRPLPSVSGREEYVRVSFVDSNDGPLVEPVFGKSGLLTTLIKGQGLVKVPADSEGMYAGDQVEVMLFP
ncbi:molybdopterin molybdotransferase MoeA [Dethiosulfatarculus sandiegensis]|uniref:Molybdopterin molybdenumtransferase n=1 Tax=Dethiosulfatarculus sandiegensis TaxID=1429043 RepID=A0A0D2J726_9BACT|nr:gephyrin-like molybdotransferase Glp [Dethiosulfatarculus sandiegensis]KIX11476.1 molybdenum cofactor biosynthesis protein [Dethiosulfatarculus sandiegensis]